MAAQSHRPPACLRRLEKDWEREINMLAIRIRQIVVLPLSLKAAIFRVVLSQIFKTLTKFIEKNAKIYSTKLIPLDLSFNIFS